MSESASSPEPVTAVAAVKAMVDNAERLGLTWELKTGVVTSLTPIMVICDGDDEGVPIFMTSMIGRLKVGERVYVFAVPPSGHFVVGAASDMTLLTVSNYTWNSVTNQSTTSLTPANVLGVASANFSLTIQKKFDLTGLRVDVHGTFFSQGAAAGPLYSVFISGVTGVNANVYNNLHNLATVAAPNASLLNHTPWGGGGVITGLSAGKATVQLRWLRATGAGTCTMNADDMLSMTVSEVWAS